MSTNATTICVIGDTHGHLQLALCVAARWQEELGVRFEAVLLCGDIGSFTEDGQLDSTTRAHAKTNPCELEFLHQWSVNPQPLWLSKIFAPIAINGLGLSCPVVMVHGNHEGFARLEALIPDVMPVAPVEVGDLPVVDTGGWIRYLPSGFRCRTASGKVIAGIGGIEMGQRAAKYPELAYLDDYAILHTLEAGPADILITHQGPQQIQGNGGSPSLDCLLDAEIAPLWFHGHSVRDDAIQRAGPNAATTVVPLGDVAFPMKGDHTDEPGLDAWSWVRMDDPLVLQRERPAFWRDFRKRKWKELPDGQLVAPPLADAVP